MVVTDQSLSTINVSTKSIMYLQNSNDSCTKKPTHSVINAGVQSIQW